MAEILLGGLIGGGLIGIIANLASRSSNENNKSSKISEVSAMNIEICENQHKIDPNTNYQTFNEIDQLLDNNYPYNQSYKNSNFDTNYNYYQNLNSYGQAYNNNNNYYNNQNNNIYKGKNHYIQSAYGVNKKNYLTNIPYQHSNRRSQVKNNNEMKILNLNHNAFIKRHLSPQNNLYGRKNKIGYLPNYEENEVKKIKWGKVLGKGGFGEVCEIVYNGYKYAGKKILKGKFTNSDVEKALEREITILTEMNCYKNSVKYYKHLEDKFSHILILELCDCDLQHFIDRSINGLDENIIYSIMNQLNNTFMLFIINI
jgi:hypothetical protein